MIEVAVTGVGVVSPLGNDVAAMRAAIAAGKSGYQRFPDDLRRVLDIPGYAMCTFDCTPHLKRKKDKKLLPRAAEIALCAAADALGSDRPDEIGGFLGVGREPSDQADTGPSLLASCTKGHLDLEKLGTVGVALYPPLAPLRTLPNLILAHVAIHLDLTGECGTRAGEEAAGIAALVEGWLAVAEGRSDVVLAGGADCRIDLGSARDLVRQGLCGPTRGPGEGAAVFRLEPLERARARGATVFAVITGGGVASGGPIAGAIRPQDFEPALGACGSAAGPLAVAASLTRTCTVEALEDSGARAWIAFSVPG